LIVKFDDRERERRDSFAGGLGGGYCTHCLPPTARIPGTRFRQVSKIELAPGASVGDHLHAGNEEIYWILSGSGVFRDDGAEVPANAGNMLLTLQGHCHGLLNTGTEPLVFLAVVAGDPDLGQG
jgi:mannose-6-phosphate isomerase-like protein (cupin superfamily)